MTPFPTTNPTATTNPPKNPHHKLLSPPTRQIVCGNVPFPLPFSATNPKFSPQQ
ncbi:MAG: hypothetical protein LUD39_04435 [Opitutae bacterium]|nr:hypothetical protein [Opitutae bacterium]